MIEIGKERTISHGARRASNAIELVAGLLVLSWLARGILGVSQYSETLLVVALGLGLLAEPFKTDVSRGAARATSSFFGHLAWWCFTTIVLIWILGWIASLQGDTLPTVFSSNVPNLAIAFLSLGILSLVSGIPTLGGKEFRARGPALLLSPNSTTEMGDAKVSVKADCIGLPVRKSRKTVGCVVTGDLNAVFETPMGIVNATIAGPATTFGVPFRGEKATGEQVEKVTGKKLGELISGAHVETSVKVGETEVEVDMPFIYVRRDQFDDSFLDLGPVRVRRGSGGQTVKIGPVSIYANEGSKWWEGDSGPKSKGKFSSWWSIKGARDSSYITSTGDGVKSKWNGSSLEFNRGSMRLKVGSDGFVYSPQELETFTPLHTLRVTKDKLTLNTKRFTLDVSGTRVILRSEDGSKSTESEELARDLRVLLAETAKKQVSDVLEGQPIELDEMLSGTEELLKKYA